MVEESVEDALVMRGVVCHHIHGIYLTREHLGGERNHSCIILVIIFGDVQSNSKIGFFLYILYFLMEK